MGGQASWQPESRQILRHDVRREAVTHVSESRFESQPRDAMLTHTSLPQLKIKLTFWDLSTRRAATSLIH